MIKKYQSQFIVTTAKGCKIANCCAIEQAEYVYYQGRSRTIWQWDNLKGRYIARK